jgi:hypothetical protein
MREHAPKQWTRKTNWRQGFVLPPEAAAHFGLTNAKDPGATCVVVVTHDCDLAIDNLDIDPEVEIIVGRTIEALGGNFTWGKSPRTLHYTAQLGETTAHIELVTTSKRTLPKRELAQFEPNPEFSLDGETLAVMRSWLSSRYNRAAFPDAFVNRMRDTKAEEKLVKALADHGKNVSFVYFDLDGGQCIERTESDPYQLRIVLVFPPGDDPDAAEDAASAAAEAVQRAVSSRLEKGDSILLKACFSISEDDITVSQARVLTQWRLEYMTFRSEEEQLGPPAI